MVDSILLYGATGYTGTLIANEAKNRGIDIILSGRDEAKLKSLSEKQKMLKKQKMVFTTNISV